MGEEFKGLFDARGVEGDCPREIPVIGVIHGFRRGARKEMVGLDVIKACRVVTELVIQ